MASAPTLINSVEVSEITASKITAGTIGAHEIILTQPGTQTSYTPPSSTAVLRSSNYSVGTAGWLIRGDGLAEFNDLTVRSRLDIGGDDASSFHVDNDGNMWLGAGISGYSTAPFRVSNTGALVASNANITGAINATSGTFQGRLQSGDIYIPNTSSPVFSVTTTGVLTATSANITGTITATGGSINGYLTAGGVTIGRMDWINNYYKGINVNGNFQSCFIRGDGGEVYLRADNGSQWIKFENGTVYIKASNFEVTNTGATFSGSLSGASGSVGANFTIGDNLFVGNFVRINGPDPSNVTVTKIRGFKNLGDTDANARWTLVLEGPNGTNKWEVRDDGLMQYRTQSAYSDIRIKSNIETSNLGLDFIKSLKPRSYNLSLGENEEGVEVFKQVKTYGFVAQEVKQAYEQYTDSFDGWGLSIAGDNDSLQTVSYDNFISPLVKAVQELSAKVDELESRLV